MTILFANNASTTIAGSITATDTTVMLAGGTGILFPNPVNAGDYFCLTFYDQATKTINEIVHCTARSGDQCTIVRGQENTTPQAWNAGDILANLITAGTLEAFVQAGAPFADTEILYVGIDTSTTPGLIIANTTPVPTSYAIGMTFVIQVNQLNNGDTYCQFNGKPGVQAVRTDGSPLIPGDFVNGYTYFFTYNGVTFTTTIMAVPIEAPQSVFYVRTDGNDNNSGFANTPQEAFATIQGCINAVRVRYIAMTGMTIRVADGYYTSGCVVSGQYISETDIVGNTTNPGNVTIDCSSLSSATYPPNAPVGVCFEFGNGAGGSVSGFTMRCAQWCLVAYSGGNVAASNNNYSGSSLGYGCIATSGGDLHLGGTNQYSSSYTVQGVILSYAGTIQCGGQSVFGISPFGMSILGSPGVSDGFAAATSGGVVAFTNAACSFSGAVVGPQYFAASGGGIVFTGPTNILPATQPGNVYPPGWVEG